MNKKNVPLVSVCIQTYQHGNYIKKCLDSVLMQQTTFPFEIIIGEDESIDGTREICEAYALKHPEKIKLFKRKRKDVIYIAGHATGRFNFINNLKAATGKYIALLDGDDYWTDALKLQKQVDFLEANPNFGICFHRVKVFNQQQQMFVEDSITREVNDVTDINELTKDNFIHTPSVMLRNDFKLPRWFKKSPIGDWTLYMIAIKNKKIKKLDDVMAVYRVHEKSVWSKFSQDIKEEKTKISIKLVIKKVRLPKETKAILTKRATLFDPPKRKNKSLKNKILTKLKSIFKK
jgi:glycosyltransferase involved in cell wall biosynthesis